jgi:hypothetical protein
MHCGAIHNCVDLIVAWRLGRSGDEVRQRLVYCRQEYMMIANLLMPQMHSRRTRRLSQRPYCIARGENAHNDE